MALGVFWATISILLISSIRHNQGYFVYALDDPYIHMSMAKNISQHGVWGISKYELTSSSSSLLWTLLLSLVYFLFGVNEASPFILNLLFGTLLVFVIYLLLRKYSLRPLFIFIVLLTTIYFTPLPSLIFCGLEHTMHALLTLLFVFISAKILSDEKSTSKENRLLLILAPLVPAARYEGLFLILIVCILFAVRRRLLYSFFLGGLATIPLVGYGVISMRSGWYFLPNSVLLKGNAPSLSITGIDKFFYNFYTQLGSNPHILILLSVALFLFVLQFNKQKTFWTDSSLMLTIYIATTLLHLMLAQTGWFYRYEAYLVALGILVIAIEMCKLLPQKLSILFDTRLLPKYVGMTLLVSILILPHARRGAMSLLTTTRATTNIYEQQYQMGLFLHEFYQGESVAANDIGAISYLAEIKILDLWGICSSEVAKSKMNGRYTTREIYDLAKQKGIKIAIVYDHWFEKYGGIPSEWINVGRWQILNNVVCGEDNVSFYALDPLQKDFLIQNLKAFSSHLLKNVVQSGDYTH
jgi:hypothetical protein